MSQALIEQVRNLLQTVDWDTNASDSEIMQAIDWVALRAAFESATATSDLEPNNYALCVHCGASHHEDEAHTCADPDDPDLLMDPVEYAAKHDKGGE